MTPRSCLIASLLVLLALVSSSAGAQTPGIDINGDWQITVNSPMGARTTPLSLMQDGEKVSGHFKSPAGELPVSGTLVGDELKLGFTLNVQGNPIDITLTGKVAGASITGMAQFSSFGEGEFTAKRPSATDAPTDAATAAPSSAPSTTTTAPAAGVGGTWIVTIVTPGGEFPATAMLVDDAGKLTGTFGSQMGEVPVTGTLEGNALKLSMIAKTPQGDLNVLMTGDVDGDSIVNGKADVTGMGQMAWTAKRKQ
jgi:hypothetical protein